MSNERILLGKNTRPELVAITAPNIIDGKIKFLLVTSALGFVETKVQIHIPAKITDSKITIAHTDLNCFFLSILEMKSKPNAVRTARPKSIIPISLDGLEPETTGIFRFINNLLNGLSIEKINAIIINKAKISSCSMP